MNKTRLLLPGTLLMFGLVFFSSCQPDEDDETTPTAERDKFLGTWTCREDSKDNGSSTFTVHIRESATGKEYISIENLYNFGFQHKANAVISGNGATFAIPSQKISGNMVSGSGSLQGTSTINMNYTVDDGAGTDTVVAVLKK